MRARRARGAAQACSCRCIQSIRRLSASVRKRQRGFSGCGQHRQPIAARNAWFSTMSQSFFLLETAPGRVSSKGIDLSADSLQFETRLGLKKPLNP